MSESFRYQLRPRFVAVDLFCGAGGTSRGLVDAGGYVVAGVDKEESCRATYEANIRNVALGGGAAHFLRRDVFPRSRSYPHGAQQELIADLDRMIRDVRLRAPGVPLLFAICAPCQPFTRLSHAVSPQRKAGRHRDRNLLAAAADLVERFAPDMILAENVAGICEERYGRVWQTFARRLNRLGYDTGSRVVCASGFGVPQFRKRSIMLAVRRAGGLGRDRIEVPETDGSGRLVTVREAIGHLPPLVAGECHPTIPNHVASILSDINLRRIRLVLPGQANHAIAADPDLALPCHRRASDRAGKPCFTDVYTRLDPDRPAGTITTNANKFSNGRYGHFDIRQDRALSLREAACLQSFPDDYVFLPLGAIRSVARMIGNAVPPRLAKFFAEHLLRIAVGPL